MPTDTERITALELAVQNLTDLLNEEKNKRQELFMQSAPVGTIAAFAGDTGENPPGGWLWCNGEPVSRATYQALFAVIRTRHGNGDGVNTFHLPDYRGRFLRGVSGPAAGRDAGPRLPMNSGGASDGLGTVQNWSTGNPKNQFTLGPVPDHAHQYSHYSGRVPIYNGVPLNLAGSEHPIAKDNLVDYSTGLAGGHSHPLIGGDTETRPINAAVNFIIKY